MADGSPPKNKAALLLAIGGLKKPKDDMGGDAEPAADGADDMAPPASDDVKSMATEDVMAAFKSGDTAALEDALSRFVGAC